MVYMMPIVRPALLRTGRFNFANSNASEPKPPTNESFTGDPSMRAPSTGGLSVLNIDMRAAENKQNHNTSKYKNSNLIVRRNKEFIISIAFNRPFNQQQDNVQIEFLIGSSPDANKGTSITVSIGNNSQANTNWQCRVINVQSSGVTVGITPDSNCIIGRFSIYVVVVTDQGKQRTPRNPDTDVYILFNPWDPADEVFLDDEAERQEYVMNDVGIIFNGNYNGVTTRTWNFGQFEQGVLDACLTILDAGKVPLIYRGNAADMARQASALMNSQDDNGVLVGNWGTDFSMGTAPTAWTGSPEILLKYVRGGCVPVCFAQCWVYAGTLNTFMRCLGIPTRVITNYCSAHDSGGSLVTDIVLDPDGRVDTDKTRDSIWNFHCWNESYMKRNDLPVQYSGWQVVDSTPQETSDGLYRCGPTSVNAVKDGALGYSFDAKFVFAEVNSEVVYHQSDKYGNMKGVTVDDTYVGKLIVTKMVNGNDYENITYEYKYPEGSAQEKQVREIIEGHGMVTNNTVPRPDDGVKIELQAGTVNIGEDFQLVMNIQNQTSQTCTVNATITGCVVFYTGVSSNVFKTENQSASVNPWSTNQQTIDVLASDYMPYLADQSNLMFIAYATVEETGASLTATRIVTLQPPQLTMQVSGTPQVGKNFTVTVQFQNPYDFALENVSLRLDGPGLIPTKIKMYKQILPGASVKYMEKITPQYSGMNVLIACLDCAAMRQVTNQLTINVV